MRKRTIGTSALFFASVSAILGSGWLFSSYYSAKLAGPASLVSWLIGGILLLIIAFVFAEICAMLPISGSSARIPQYSHGISISVTFSWVIWLSYLALMGAEIQAILQYLSFYFPTLTKAGGGLTGSGYIGAVFISLLVAIINVYSIRLLMKANSFLTYFKLLIPIFVVLVIFIHQFSLAKIIGTASVEHGGFAPYGWHGIFAAISGGGVVFAFNGFKQAAEMAGEAKKPSLTVPLATVGSIAACMGLFLLLQMAFLTSVTHANLITGWHHFVLGGSNSPLASIIKQDGMPWLNSVLFAGAIIAPFAAAPMYCASAARSLYGISKNGFAPKLFQKLSVHGNPMYAILLNFFLGLLVFAPLPGWESIAAFLTSLLAITYALGPVCLLSLRKQLPKRQRKFKLPFGTAWATVAFFICTMLSYWSGWAIIWKLDIFITIGYVIFLIYYAIIGRKTIDNIDFKSSIWLWLYLIGLGILSYLGNFGGIHALSPFEELGLLFVLSCSILWIATALRLDSVKTKAYVKELNL